jgi:hypothetical protein
LLLSAQMLLIGLGDTCFCTLVRAAERAIPWTAFSLKTRREDIAVLPSIKLRTVTKPLHDSWLKALNRSPE